MKEERYHIALDDYEHGVVIRALNDTKTELMNEGKSTDAVFLPASVVPACREVDTDAHSVAEKQNEDSFYTVLAKLYMKWVAHHIHQARQYLRQAAFHRRCNEKSEPHNRQDAEYGENDGGLSVVISIHDRSSPFFPLP